MIELNQQTIHLAACLKMLHGQSLLVAWICAMNCMNSCCRENARYHCMWRCRLTQHNCKFVPCQRRTCCVKVNFCISKAQIYQVNFVASKKQCCLVKICLLHEFVLWFVLWISYKHCGTNVASYDQTRSGSTILGSFWSFIHPRARQDLYSSPSIHLPIYSRFGGLLCLVWSVIVKHILFEPSKRSSRPSGSCSARLAERGHECMIQEVDLRS